MKHQPSREAMAGRNQLHENRQIGEVPVFELRKFVFFV